jgi:hypothetical protein
VLQDGTDGGGAQVGQVQLGGQFAALLVDVAEQQGEGVAVGAMVCGLAPRWVISRSVKKASRIGASAVIAASRRRRPGGVAMPSRTTSRAKFPARRAAGPGARCW